MLIGHLVFPFTVNKYHKTQLFIVQVSKWSRGNSVTGVSDPSVNVWTMILVDGEAEERVTNQYRFKLGLDYPIGQFTFHFTINK